MVEPLLTSELLLQEHLRHDLAVGEARAEAVGQGVLQRAPEALDRPGDLVGAPQDLDPEPAAVALVGEILEGGRGLERDVRDVTLLHGYSSDELAFRASRWLWFQ